MTFIKGHKHSQETRKKMSDSRKGSIGFWRGKNRPPMSAEWRKKLSLAGKRRKQTEETKKKIGDTKRGKPFKGTPWRWTGKHFSEEHKRNISDSNKGVNSPNWMGGITKENHKIRRGIDFRLWREAVFARDNWTCQKTGKRGVKLHPHHIKNFYLFPDLRFAIDNGITLSEEAHREFHKKYGNKKNTKEQLAEFLKET